MRYYVSKCHNSLNAVDYSPEKVTPYLCLNPYYPVKLTPGKRVRYVLDSGAFQDVRSEQRLSFEDALNRQLMFEKNVGRRAEALVSYDRLVDEQINDTGQFKKRVDSSTGSEYVEETIRAAEFLSSKRHGLGQRKLILSCQGTSTEQYLQCIESILDFAEPEDIIGFGGFCILSKSKTYEKEFYEVISKAFPMIRDAGISRIHIFGMGVFRVLVQTDIFARMNGIECSYDTSAPEMNAVFGKSFNPIEGQMNKVFNKIHKNNGYVSADLALFNVKMITNYWKNMEEMPLPKSFEPSL